MKTNLQKVCVALGFLLLVFCVAVQAVDPGDNWEWRSRVPQGNTLYDVTYSAGQFVGVGGSGAIITSPDGVTWAVRMSGASSTLRGVSGSGSVYVAVGDEGTILSSYDGHAWAAQAGGAGLNFTDIAWSGREFVAVAGGGQVMRSTDGATWTQHGTGWGQDLNGIAWGGSGFLTAGRNSNAHLSANGSSWAYANPPGTIHTLQGVAWAGTQYVLVGDGGNIHTSPNGTGWTKQTSGTGAQLLDVTSGGSLIVAVGGGGVIRTSTDGVTWAGGSSGTSAGLESIAWGNGTYVAVGSAGTILSSTDGANWSVRNSVLTLETLNGIGWSGSQFVVAGNSGQIYSSPQGTVWTPASSGTNVNLHAACWGASQWVVVGDNGDIRTSPDGVTWTSQTSGTSQPLRGVEWNGSLFVAVGGAGTILSSADGVTWTPRPGAPSYYTLQGIAWGNGTFVVVASIWDVYISSDGINWTSALTDYAAYNGLNDITWTGSRFLAVGNRATYTQNWRETMVSSPDGMTWTNLTVGNVRTYTAVAWGNNRFVIVGRDPSVAGLIFTSPDGKVLTERSRSMTTGINDIIWAGSQFIAVGRDGAILGSGVPSQAPQYTLTYLALPGGGIVGAASQTVSAGGSGTEVNAVSEAGAVFTGWSDGVATTNRTDANVQGNLQVSAHFESVGGVDISWFDDNGFEPGPGETWADLDNVVPPGKTQPLWVDYICLTDPNDPVSVFEVTHIGLGDPPEITVVPSAQIRVYTLKFCTDLAIGDWQDVVGQVGVPGGGPLSGMSSNVPIFYRAVVALPTD